VFNLWLESFMRKCLIMLLSGWSVCVFAQTNGQSLFDADEVKFNEHLKALFAAQSSYLEKGQTNECRQIHKQISDLVDQRKYPRAIHALQQAKSEEERFYALDGAAKESLNVGKKDEAKSYADELESLMEKYKGDWNYGNAVQDVNIVLGRLALAEGKVEEAKADLLKAGKSPGSPQMNSFGPNMSLAKELLEKGEKNVVLEYFELCRKFWSFHNDKLDEWSRDVKIGKTPRFGANLEY
jgi:predicted S18 family serine protease